MPKANWDTVMYCDNTNELIIGVSAWKAPTYANFAAGKIGGIKEVRISVDNGPWLVVTNRVTSPVTGVRDLFCARVKVADYEAAVRSEIRAAVICDSGKPRVLQGTPVLTNKFGGNDQWSLFVTANKGGALDMPARYMSPFGNDSNDGLTDSSPMLTSEAAIASIKTQTGSADVGGAKLYLLPGTYTDFGVPGVWDTSTANPQHAAATRWFTVMPAPGVSASEIEMTMTERGVNVHRTRLKDFKVIGRIGTGSSTSINRSASLNVSGVTLEGLIAGVKTGGPLVSMGDGGVWWTEVMQRNYLYGLGSSVSVMVRNCGTDGVDGEQFTMVKVLLQATAQNAVRTGNAHPDVYQWVNLGVDIKRNWVIYGLDAYKNINHQGMFADGGGQCIDAAVIKLKIGRGGEAHAFKFGSAPIDAFFLDLEIVGDQRRLNWSNTASDVRFVNNRSGGPVTYLPGVSYLYEGMPPGEPYDGPPPPSTPIVVLGDAAGPELGDVWQVFDAIRLDKTTLVTPEDSDVTRLNVWRNAGEANYSMTQATTDLMPYFDPFGLSMAYPALVYDKTAGTNQYIGTTTVPSFAAVNTDFETWMVIEHHIDAASPYAAESQTYFWLGGSTSLGNMHLRRSFSGGNHTFTFACAAGAAGTGTTSISAAVVSPALIGVCIVRAQKTQTGITLTVWADGVPDGMSTTTPTAGTDIPYIASAGRFRVGTNYNQVLTNTFQGAIHKLLFTKPLDGTKTANLLAGLKSDIGITW
jgi:hypothetical protein